MSGRFLITGLPRSRTAWFAVATGAQHELFSHIGYLRPWSGGGVSDSGAARELRYLLALYAPRTLIIERPKADVMASMMRYISGVPIKMARNKLDAYLDASLDGIRYNHPLICRVSFDSLSSIKVVRKCLAWLEVSEPANLEMLMHMNIQSDIQWNLALHRRMTAA